MLYWCIFNIALKCSCLTLHTRQKKYYTGLRKEKALNWYVLVNYKFVMFMYYIPNMKANV